MAAPERRMMVTESPARLVHSIVVVSPAVTLASDSGRGALGSRLVCALASAARAERVARTEKRMAVELRRE